MKITDLPSFTQRCLEIASETDDDNHLMFFTEKSDATGVLALAIHADVDMADANRRLRGAAAQALAHRFAAMATVLNWTGLPEPAPCVPTWAFSIVETGKPSVFVMLTRGTQDVTMLNPHDVPWMLLSNAASCRVALEGGDPPVLKSHLDADASNALFDTPAETPNPSTDSRGLL